MAIPQPSATTRAEHITAAEYALARAYKLADANENVDPEFWLSLSAQHSILAQLKA
ncbi:hypothetical protein [Rhodococcus sp. KRD197]|jgi:hypothetical protein|uniref:hypothetical protein n=1 Tax=Rhodococcus sp. KRD197 TaxID=2729731 RepID=UPI0019CF8521|nr:hypothetical protein [Rhodococcus sp. KRD197]